MTRKRTGPTIAPALLLIVTLCHGTLAAATKGEGCSASDRSAN
jgi:hypothetical protein